MFKPGFVHAKRWLPFNTPLLLKAGESAQADEHVFGGKRTPLFDKPLPHPTDRGVTYEYICGRKGRKEEIFYDLHSQPCVTLASFESCLLC